MTKFLFNFIYILGAVLLITVFILFKKGPKNNILGNQDQAKIEISPTPSPSPSVSPSPSPSPSPTPKPSPSLKPTPKPSPSPSPSPKIYPTSQELDDCFAKYGAQYGVDLNVLRQLASCESGFNTYAVNGPYAGLFQFNSSSWKSARQRMNLDTNPALRFSWEESIKTAAFKISQDGMKAWPACQNKL